MGIISRLVRDRGWRRPKSIDMAEQNGNLEVVDLTNSSGGTIAEIAELEARELLGVSREEAFEMLDRGELRGTAVASEFKTLSLLLRDD
jgi:hypothetical protein